MKKFKKLKKTGMYLVLIIAGVLIGRIFFGNGHQSTTEELHSHDKNEVWTCSMHPQIRESKPGKCPLCGMDLVKVNTDTDSGVMPNQIQLSNESAMLANIQTTLVTKGTPEKTIFLSGKIMADERAISSQTSHIPGRIEKLYVTFTGEQVYKGQKLVSIYSPELITAQNELFEALKYAESNPTLVESARRKLELWKLSKAQIAEIEQSGIAKTEFDVLADFSGIVTGRKVTTGDHVKQGHELFTLVNLEKVWVLFDAYEQDLPWIKVGDKISFTVASFPGKAFESSVTFIDPVIQVQKRVALIRTEMNNAGNLLKPEMFVSGVLKTSIGINSEHIIIPKSAVLWTGKRSIVYVKVPSQEMPVFELRDIVLGPDAGKFYIVEEGLSEKEEVVTNGVFKIDAAAQLQGKKSMMNPEGGKISTGHDHGGDKESLPDFTSQIPEKLKKQIGELIVSYLNLESSFVSGDLNTVNSTVKKMLRTMSNIDNSELATESNNHWKVIAETISTALNSIETNKEINNKKVAFSKLSDSIWSLAKSFGFDMAGSKTIYRVYCPMAFENKGAYWIADSKEIANPYFGNKMLTCGEVVEELR